MKQILLNILCILIAGLQPLYARQIRLYGYVTDSENIGIEFVNVVAANQGISQTDTPQTGTTTNKNGYYELLLDQKDTIVLVYSMVGLQTMQQRIINPQDVMNINVQMAADELWVEEVEVRGIKHQQGTMEQLNMESARMLPDATGGSIESLLITFAGVSQNNELSSQYNVRGGSFDENQVYVNGMEVHRPLLIRSGQQEGLSFVNPHMVDNVTFSAGGFDAQYGDKMSSVLSIAYKRPSRFEASLSASLLGADVYVGTGDSTYSHMHGIRYKTSQYMLGGLKTTGNYKPNYIDYQTYITWQVGKKHPWTMSFLGNYSQNDYQFQPDSLSESFGGLDTKNLNIWYEGQEKDRFITGFAALGAHGKVSDEVELGFDLSGFYTHEQENFDIGGEYVLSEQGTNALATGRYHEHARNTLQAGVVSVSHNGRWTRKDNTFEWGVSGQAELINDQINEWQWRDSAGYSQPYMTGQVNLFYAMRGTQTMRTARLQTYIQNTHKWRTKGGVVLLNIGGRLNWSSYTGELLPSPRASLVYNPGWKRDISFRLATGLYYQAPFYKELRDTVTMADGVTYTQLNRDLRAQRSVHVVLGGDYYFRAWGRPFKLSAEGYYKYIDRMESYTVDNVRIRYSGKNDSEGYAVGLDLKLYGELVPGADSWISFSTMRARQRFIDEHQSVGWIPSPQEQRYAFSMLFQDYLPQLPQLRFHLKMIMSDGMPFSAPNNLNTMRYYRMDSYKRIDIGASYTFNKKTAKFMREASAKHVKEWAVQFEVFNLVGWNNVNSYFWVSDANGNQWASPNYLTGRRYNVKIRIDLE